MLKEGSIMLKKLVLCIVVVLAVMSSAFGEVEMWFDNCYFIAIHQGWES